VSSGDWGGGGGGGEGCDGEEGGDAEGGEGARKEEIKSTGSIGYVNSVDFGCGFRRWILWKCGGVEWSVLG